jgi:hypothetical protein
LSSATKCGANLVGTRSRDCLKTRSADIPVRSDRPSTISIAYAKRSCSHIAAHIRCNGREGGVPRKLCSMEKVDRCGQEETVSKLWFRDDIHVTSTSSPINDCCPKNTKLGTMWKSCGNRPYRLARALCFGRDVFRRLSQNPDRGHSCPQRSTFYHKHCIG